MKLGPSLSRSTWLAALVCLGLLAGPGAQASDLALDISGTGSGFPCGNCGSSGATFGWSFTLTSSMTVDGLGLWDDGANGLGASYQVGLWRASDGALLTSATVSDGSTVVASQNTTGRWLFESVTPLNLDAGNYQIGALFYDTAPLAQVSAPYTTVAAVTNIAGARGPLNGGFAAPTNAFAVPLFGPTFSAVSPVPEADTAALMAVGGLALAAVVRRRRKA